MSVFYNTGKPGASKMRYFFIPLFILCFVAACDDNSAELPFAERGAVIEWKEGGSVSKENVIKYVTELSASNIARHNVTYYVITYRTQYAGKPINSNGLLMIPDGVSNPKLTAYFHGTQIPLKMDIFERQIPSHYDGGKDDFKEIINMGLSWSSAGYAVFMPDYIGYGMTINEEHPYVYFPEMFKSNIDGLLAARKLLTDKGFPSDKDLFLTGWSEGAGASLSAHKYIQEFHSTDFTVVASSGLAGPYNFTGFMDDIFARRKESVNIASIGSWGLYAMNKFSDLKRPTDQIWSYPVFDQMSAIGVPSKVPDKFLNNFFLSKMIDSSDVDFRQVCEKNSFHKGWKPVGKVFLHHGDADDVVPIFNSVDAFEGLQSAGGNIKLYLYQGGKHDTDLGNYILNTLNDFNALR